ncbi:26623_t:CDS:2 [Dentiscutata erythropus]|uniref:26623_t:CDS:1 n=1 Tax=Dentiscutata erythropus TaxID=1348616 RepID=A0A9N8WAK1_9GLOM|nr:26623_t:CDS:2 [Dentiscutata erythropus]
MKLKAISYYQKATGIKNIEGCNKPIQEAETIEEVKVFRAIAQEYFLEDSDKEVKTIPWDNTYDWSKWEDNGKETESTNTKPEYKELTTQEIEHKKYIQDLLTKLALKFRIDITWSIRNRYQNKYTNHRPENKPQLIDLGKIYLINIPQWENHQRAKIWRQ